MSKRKAQRGLTTAIVCLVVVFIAAVLAGATYSNGSKRSNPLGRFNPAINSGATVEPLGEIGPGACWPANYFNNANGVEMAVKYVSGHDPNDTKHQASGVASRDVAWLSQHASYYHYTAGETDAQWHSGLVLEQLPYEITVQNTFCPAGQDTVQLWKVVTLPVGEWVFFLKGHAPSDVANNPSVGLVPVRKAVCGNFLLPPPSNKRTVTPTPSHVTAPPRTTPPSSTVPSTTTTSKPPLSFNCQQNGIGCPPQAHPRWVQPVQNNTTSGVNTGHTSNTAVSNPPPANRSSGDPNGGSGTGSAPSTTTTPPDTSLSGDTSATTQPCPFGQGNC